MPSTLNWKRTAELAQCPSRVAKISCACLLIETGRGQRGRERVPHPSEVSRPPQGAGRGGGRGGHWEWRGGGRRHDGLCLLNSGVQALRSAPVPDEIGPDSDRLELGHQVGNFFALHLIKCVCFLPFAFSRGTKSQVLSFFFSEPREIFRNLKEQQLEVETSCERRTISLKYFNNERIKIAKE